MSSVSVVAGLAVFSLLGRFGYIWVACSLVMVAFGMRIVGVVSGNNAMRGLPENRTSIGAALTDTSSEIASGASTAIAGTLMAMLFVGNISNEPWTMRQSASFATTVTVVAIARGSRTELSGCRWTHVITTRWRRRCCKAWAETWASALNRCTIGRGSPIRMLR